jgi:UDP-glucose:(heptosyl)LPS alpha-1,3-glucosyltransferase
MRIALVVERFEPAGGGVEQVVWKVAHGLAEAGDEVHVITARGVDARAVELHRVEVPTFWQPLRVSRFVWKAARELERESFDVVHSFSRTLHQDVFNAGGGSHADYMRNTYGEWGVRARRLSPRHALLLAIERRIFENPQQTIQCVSRMVRNEIARRYRVPDSRLVLIYNGVDAQRFDPERHSRARWEERAHLRSQDATVWLLAGSGWRRKGLDTALRALAASRDQDSQLWVVGGDTTDAWHRLAVRLGVVERVRFLGPRSDLERVYAAADGLLLPTRYDAFGLVCLEAAASGIPVITSAAAGAAELLAEAGVVVSDPEDAAGFAEALDRLSDPSLREQLGERGRLVAEGCSWKTHVDALRSLYARVAR